MTRDELIYNSASRYLGVKETPGKGTTKLIRQWIKEAASWLDGDDSATAWCGCFRGAIGMETGTGVPAEHYRAASWMQWGYAVNRHDPSQWKKGMTVVLLRPGGHHVALLDRVRGDKVYLLGGNQSDCVCIQHYPLKAVVAVRSGV